MDLQQVTKGLEDVNKRRKFTLEINLKIDEI